MVALEGRDGIPTTVIASVEQGREAMSRAGHLVGKTVPLAYLQTSPNICQPD